MRKFAKLFPSVPAEYAYGWAGTFAEPEDGLPYIDRIQPRSNVFVSCGYGGNGITFSVTAAQVLADTITGEEHPDADLYAIRR